MQRYFAIDKKLTLNDSDLHHIKNVMRMKTGDKIEVVFEDTIYDCILDMSNLSFKVENKRKEEIEKPEIIIAFSLLKEQKIDYLLQKATEVGASGFIPFMSKRSIIKFDFKKEDSKIDRWNKILKEASEQCFRVDVPNISNVLTLNELSKCRADLKILLTLNEKTKNIKKVIEQNKKCDKIIIVVGPEGGFEKSEETLLIVNDFISTSLGKNVLRAETAPVAVVSMIKYEFMR